MNNIEEEADAVIDEIKREGGVLSISLDQQLNKTLGIPSRKCIITIVLQDVNPSTKINQLLIVEFAASGFRQIDSSGKSVSSYFETLPALLMDKSTAYKNNFSNSLFHKLLALQKQQNEEQEDEEAK